MLPLGRIGDALYIILDMRAGPAAAARGAASSVATQGIGVATGLQDKFSWAGVAAAGVGAGIGNLVGGAVTGKLGSKFVERLAANSAGGIANAATRSLIEGTSFGDNVLDYGDSLQISMVDGV